MHGHRKLSICWWFFFFSEVPLSPCTSSDLWWLTEMKLLIKNFRWVFFFFFYLILTKMGPNRHFFVVCSGPFWCMPTQTFTSPLIVHLFNLPCFSAEYFWLIWASFGCLHMHYVLSSLEKSLFQMGSVPGEWFIFLFRTTTILWRYTPKQTGITSNHHKAACGFFSAWLVLGRTNAAGHPN